MNLSELRTTGVICWIKTAGAATLLAAAPIGAGLGVLIAAASGSRVPLVEYGSGPESWLTLLTAVSAPI